MSDPRETLARIRAQVGAASEGPWTPPTPRMQHFTRADHDVDRRAHMSIPDAEFVAAARTTVPALVDALEGVLAIHRDGGESQGYLDNGHYGVIDHCCTECGSYGEYGTPWPCPTVTAITTTLEGETRD